MPSIQFEFDYTDLDPLLARMAAAPFALEEEIGKAVVESTDYLRDLVRVYTPVDTGRLRESEKAQTDVYFGSVQGRVFSDLNYAAYVEEGHGEIRPKRAKALRFTPQGAVGPVFRMRTRPVAGRHMFRDAREFGIPVVRERFQRAMHDLAKRIAG